MRRLPTVLDAMKHILQVVLNALQNSTVNTLIGEESLEIYVFKAEKLNLFFTY